MMEMYAKWKTGALVIGSLLSLPVLMSAQDQTLFGRSSRFGLFVQTGLETGKIKSDRQTGVNAGAGLIFGDGFIGAYGQGYADLDGWNWQGNDNSIDFAHGGLWLGYTPYQTRAIHPFSSVKLGWGAVDIQDIDNFDPTIDDFDQVWVIQPDLGLELNVFRFMRLSGTVGYRWVNDVELNGLSNGDFRGWTAGLSLRIGWFGNSKCAWKK